MSVADPILKELKVCIFDLRRESQNCEITDRHPNLMLLCQLIESIFRKGLHGSLLTFGRIKRDYWHWIECITNQAKIRHIKSSVCQCVNQVKECKNVRLHAGRGRLFIRTALVKQCLYDAIECLIKDKTWLKSVYNTDVSFIGHPVLSETLMIMLSELTHICFNLKLYNASFLDESWLLPIYKRYEFVPCNSLGITVGFKNHRAVVVKVDAGSVGGEEDQIEVGDVVDELYGISLYEKKQRHINSIMRNYRGLPVYVSVVKCHFQSGTIYPLIANSLRELGLNIDELIAKFVAKEAQLCQRYTLMEKEGHDAVLSDILGIHDDSSKDLDSVKGESVCLLGTTYVGDRGRVSEIELGLTKVVNSHNLSKSVKLLVKETEVRIMDCESGDILHKHSFTEISSCGRRKDIPEYFAYIVGDTTCSISKHFTCFVFQATSSDRAKILLCSIVQGFNRTHWAV